MVRLVGQSSSFLGLPYGILIMNHKKELQWGLWVGLQLIPCLAVWPGFVAVRLGSESLELKAEVPKDQTLFRTHPKPLRP